MMVLLWIFIILAVCQHEYVLAISSYTAMGDSYAAGYGAGPSSWIPKLDPLCGRTSYAYPKLMADELGLTDPGQRKRFRNAACGGATTVSIMQTQLSQVKDSELITLTVGGNEVDFFAVLNECVHQWRPIKGCDRTLETTRQAIESTKFINNFERLVEEIMTTLDPKARLFVTGYARFFNDTTDQCDHTSFSLTQPKNHLTKDLRGKLNALMIVLNDVIKAACQAHGAVYVDVDQIFEGHRFCEAGVNEPSEREQTWFFNLKFADQLQNQGLIDIEQGDNFFETTRVFHPTMAGHKAISEEILLLASSNQIEVLQGTS